MDDLRISISLVSVVEKFALKSIPMSEDVSGLRLIVVPSERRKRERVFVRWVLTLTVSLRKRSPLSSERLLMVEGELFSQFSAFSMEAAISVAELGPSGSCFIGVGGSGGGGVGSKVTLGGGELWGGSSCWDGSLAIGFEDSSSEAISLVSEGVVVVKREILRTSQSSSLSSSSS